VSAPATPTEIEPPARYCLLDASGDVERTLYIRGVSEDTAYAIAEESGRRFTLESLQQVLDDDRLVPVEAAPC